LSKLLKITQDYSRFLKYGARIVPRIRVRSAGQSAKIPLLVGLIFCNIGQNKSQLLDNGLNTILGFNLLV